MAASGRGGAASSYARIHGEVSREPAEWRDIPTVARETLQEVLYQKADADGIARVSVPCSQLCKVLILPKVCTVSQYCDNTCVGPFAYFLQAMSSVLLKAC